MEFYFESKAKINNFIIINFVMFYTIQIVNRQNSYIVTSRFNDSILILHNRYIYLHFYKDILFFHNIKNENTYLWFVYSKEILILFVFRDQYYQIQSWIESVYKQPSECSTKIVSKHDSNSRDLENLDIHVSRDTFENPSRPDLTRTEPNRVSGTRDFRILAHL